MDAPQDNFLAPCLFFNANAFARHLVKLAEAEFKPLKLSPAHASLLLLVYESPGISPKDLSRLLQLNPSTITRFIDALVKRDMVKRDSRGKQAYIHPTIKSLGMKPRVAQAYKNLFVRYSDILGPEAAVFLSDRISNANDLIRTALADTDEPA